MLSWAKRENIKAGTLTAIGALSSVLFGWFNKDLRAHRDIPVDQQVECISFLGDIGFAEASPPCTSTAVSAAPTAPSRAVTCSEPSFGRP
jgi:predicted DNA-binding protein with PD1-like motif